jgi:hypothetical protein
MTALEVLIKKAALLSNCRDELRAELMLLDTELQAAKAARLKRLQQLTRSVIKHQTELGADIATNASLFAKPRTQIVDGIKFGMQKQPGSMQWDDADKVLNRMDDLFNKGDINRAQYDVCVQTSYTLVSAGIEQLDGKLLKKLGITVSADTDKVLIKSVDSQVEKMLSAIIKDAVKDAANDANQLGASQERA